MSLLTQAVLGAVVFMLILWVLTVILERRAASKELETKERLIAPTSGIEPTETWPRQ